jgi:hypothetical protein
MGYPQYAAAGGNNRGNNDRIVKRTKIKESKTGKEYNYAYVEIKGNLYKISVTDAMKESNADNAGAYWLGIKDCGRVQAGNQRSRFSGNGPLRSYQN